jgi:hypothetical protein
VPPGEAKWARSTDAARIVRKAAALPRLAPNPTYAVCAHERLTGLPATATGVAAADVFA